MEDRVMMTAEERRRTREGVFFLVLFALTIPAANWLIGHVGTACTAPHGPCVVPVAPGITAPSGVMMVGVALVLRDLVQRRLGAAMSALAILVGAGISALIAPCGTDLRLRGRIPAFRVRRSRRLHAAGAAPPRRRRDSIELCRACRRTRSCFCGWRSARWTFFSGKLSARPGWCCCRYRSSPGCGAAMNGSGCGQHDFSTSSTG